MWDGFVREQLNSPVSRLVWGEATGIGVGCGGTGVDEGGGSGNGWARERGCNGSAFSANPELFIY